MKKSIVKACTALLCGALAAATIAAGSLISATAYQGQFTDITSSDWFYADVAEAYTRDLINGKTTTTFEPSGTLTIAETIKLASCCHQILKNGTVDKSIAGSGANWYDGYVDYAMTNGIISETYENYNANASRGMVAVIFNRAIKSSGKEMTDINTINSGELSDVADDAWYSSGVYSLYRLGIMTGDENGNINPESSVKRSEISAVIMRVLDSSRRKQVGTSSASSSQTSTEQTSETETKTETKTETSDSSVTLYTGNRTLATVEGVKCVAADFDTSTPGVPSGAFNLDLISDVVLEKDNISFNVYKDTGYDSLATIRALLDAVACGKDGKSIAEEADKKEGLNSTAFVFIDGTRYTLGSLWYSEYTDYTAYALYFDKELTPSEVSNVRFLIGYASSATLSKYSLTTLSELLAGTDDYKESTVSSSTNISDITIAYATAYNNVKNNAAEIIFEDESTRCTMLYGRGLNGTASTQYSLIFVYKDGTVQVVKTTMLENVHYNSTKNTLFFYEKGTDGKYCQNAINFNEPQNALAND